ncbi:MAG TPA: sugar transferase [Methylomirabilota bacterium]|nr:sugar transferase [Methylomirabilota bacterium]
MRADAAISDIKVAVHERPGLRTPFGGKAEVVRLLPAVFVAVAAAVDAAVLVGSFALASVVRSAPPTGSNGQFAFDSTDSMAVIVAVFGVGLLALRGLYDFERPQPWPSLLYAIVASLSIAIVGTVGLSLFLSEPFARSWSALGSVFALLGLTTWHTAIARSYPVLTGILMPARRVIIVGANPAGQESARDLEQKGYQVVGYADNGTDLLEIDRPLLGPIARLEELVQNFGVDELLIALPADRRAQLSRVLIRGFGRYVHVKYAPDLGELLPRHFNVSRIGARDYIDFAPVARVSWVKHATDLTLALSGLALLAPLFLVLAVAIKLDSPGPTFYGHARVGKDGRRFRMLKFRSMRQDAEACIAELRQRNEVSGPMFKIRRDPRVTRVGRFLRRYSLDELPQLLNVVRGEMSLVGPRPPLVAEVERYEDWELGRLRAVPGITGLWQVSGRAEVPFHDMVRLDLHYIRNWSFALDTEILLRTIPAVLTTKGAY